MTDPFADAVTAAQAAQAAAAQKDAVIAQALAQHTADANALAALQAELAAQKPIAYTVAVGDTLAAIGRTLGVDWHQLQAWNGLTTTTIRPGQQLLAIVGSGSGFGHQRFGDSPFAPGDPQP